jgi:hypothetical protein
MRIVLIIACAAAFVFSAWSNMPSADAKQAGDFSVNPVSMMSNVTNLPIEQFDAY